MPGHTQGDSSHIVACTLGQITWFTVYFVWFSKAITYHRTLNAFSNAGDAEILSPTGPSKLADIDFPCTRIVVLALTVFSNSIVVLTMLFRIFMLASNGFDIDKFEAAYFGGGELWHE